MGKARKPSQAREHLTLRLDPHVEYTFSQYARWAGVTRSELGRMVIEQAVTRFKRHGRGWVQRQMAEHTKTTEGGSAGAMDGGSCALTGHSVSRLDGVPTALEEVDHE